MYSADLKRCYLILFGDDPGKDAVGSRCVGRGRTLVEENSCRWHGDLKHDQESMIYCIFFLEIISYLDLIYISKQNLYNNL